MKLTAKHAPPVQKSTSRREQKQAMEPATCTVDGALVGDPQFLTGLHYSPPSGEKNLVDYLALGAVQSRRILRVTNELGESIDLKTQVPISKLRLTAPDQYWEHQALTRPGSTLPAGLLDIKTGEWKLTDAEQFGNDEEKTKFKGIVRGIFPSSELTNKLLDELKTNGFQQTKPLILAPVITNVEDLKLAATDPEGFLQKISTLEWVSQHPEFLVVDGAHRATLMRLHSEVLNMDKAWCIFCDPMISAQERDSLATGENLSTQTHVATNLYDKMMFVYERSLPKDAKGKAILSQATIAAMHKEIKGTSQASQLKQAADALGPEGLALLRQDCKQASSHNRLLVLSNINTKDFKAVPVEQKKWLFEYARAEG